MKNENYKKNNQGITLISLVVTIIVLLILSSVSIAIITGDNGILIKAKEAEEMHKRADEAEQEEIDSIMDEIHGEMWRIDKGKNRYAVDSLTISMTSIYHDDDMLTLDEYKQLYISELEMNSILDEMNETIKMLGMDNFMDAAYYLNVVNPDDPVEEGFFENSIIDNILLYLGFSEDNLKEIEKEYLSYVQENEAKNVNRIPEKIKNKIYTIQYPDGRTEDVKGQDLWKFEAKCKIQNNGIKTIKIDEAGNSKEINFEVSNIIKLQTDEYYIYIPNSKGYAVKAIDETLTSYGKMKNSIDNVPIVNMVSMFSNCANVVSIDMSDIDTKNVSYMVAMFSNCTSLKNLNLSDFNTSNVTSMESMFEDCTSLENLNLSNFNTSNVTSMARMFANCKGLTNLNIDNFDTSNVTSMEHMFYTCSSLENLNLSNFDTSNVTSMKCMFYTCSGLRNVDLSNFDTSNVTSMTNMFRGCFRLINLDISTFDTSNVTNMIMMFDGCNNLKSILVGEKWTTEKAETTDMFSNCGVSEVTRL